VVNRASNPHHLKQREYILLHAAKLFADAGYAVTTMDALSEETEMNKASLYYYFGCKSDILFELSKLAIEDGVQRAPAGDAYEIGARWARPPDRSRGSKPHFPARAPLLRRFSPPPSSTSWSRCSAVT
jgi:AcrR family transcriptional regulator